MRITAPDVSPAIAMAQLYHWFHPIANPRAGSTKREQLWAIMPGRGRSDAISPTPCIYSASNGSASSTENDGLGAKYDLTMAQIPKLVKQYPKNRDNGPPVANALPMFRKRPTPMVPPMAIN